MRRTILVTNYYHYKTLSPDKAPITVNIRLVPIQSCTGDNIRVHAVDDGYNRLRLLQSDFRLQLLYRTTRNIEYFLRVHTY